MKNFKVLFILGLSSIALQMPLTSWATSAASGKLTFTLKTAATPISVSNLAEAGAYQSLAQQVSQVPMNGVISLQAIRDFDSKLTGVSLAIASAVQAITDPSNRYDYIYDLLDANPWANILYVYTEGDESDDEPMYSVVNRELRDGKPDTEAAAVWVKRMREAMWHLPRFEGISFRGTRLTEDRIAKYYPVGELAQDAAFISTSIRPATALKFADLNLEGQNNSDDQKIAVLLVVLGKTGRPVSSFAKIVTHEEEILFANGTPMRVQSKSPVFEDTELGKTQIIVLAEQ
jgi:hypothetical protein